VYVSPHHQIFDNSNYLQARAAIPVRAEVQEQL
jgi:hypothetical protein